MLSIHSVRLQRGGSLRDRTLVMTALPERLYRGLGSALEMKRAHARPCHRLREIFRGWREMVCRQATPHWGD